MLLSNIIVLNWKDSVHPESGGAESYCQNIASELARNGARVTYLTSRPKGSSRQDRADGYTILRLGSRLTLYPLALIWILRHRRTIDAIIDSQNGIPFFSPLTASRRTPIVMLVHHVHQSQFAMYFPPFLAAIGRLLESTVARLVYGKRPVCAVSPSTRTEVRRQLRVRGPIYITPNGHRIAYEIERARSARPTITCVGRLTAHKRWHLVVTAAAALVADGVPVQVNIVGSGPEAERLSDQVTALGLDSHVTLYGYVPDAERDRLLAEAWLTVSTSVGEGWGLSVIEAAAQGVPAVALDVPGLRDSVRNGETGWLTTESELAMTLADVLSKLDDPTYADDISRTCRAWAGTLRWSSTADRFLAVLSAEQIRLAWPRTLRPSRSDNAALVTLDQAAARMIDERALGLTDQTTFCRACVDKIDGPFAMVLSAADEHDAARSLRRFGLEPTGAVDIRLCRGSDLIQWHGTALPHNALPSLTPWSCPVVRQAASNPREIGRRSA